MPTVLHVLPHPGGGAETYIDLLEALPDYRHERIPISISRSRRRGVVSVLRRRHEVIRRGREADLVHVHGDMAAMIAAPPLRGQPLLITSHGLHRLRRARGLSGWLIRRRLVQAVAVSARTICIAHDEYEDLSATLPGALRRRLVEVPNGVPLPATTEPSRRTAVRASLGLGEDEVAVLFVGQLERRKDPLGAVDAVEAARAGGARLVLLLAGDGPLAAAVTARSGDGVRALGFREDVEDLYAAADIFLLPSHREGMSFALLEAMAHGLTPLVADGRGNAETIADAGLLFAAGDHEAMAARLAELATDPQMRDRLGTAARERVRTELSVDRFRARTREVYEAVLAGAAAQGA